MRADELLERLECAPIIAAVRESTWKAALRATPEVLFYLEASILTVAERTAQAHEAGKILFVHMDLAEGMGKDKAALQYMVKCGVDGIISTRPQTVKAAKELGLLTVQRYFGLDSQGMSSAGDMLRSVNPHFMEIMPGVIPKTIRHFARGGIPVIAGGLIETKAEITAALSSGAAAISTGCVPLWEV